MNIELKSPLYSQLELTENCNNFCNYCYNHWRKDNKYHSEEKYDMNHFKKIVDELVNNEVFQLTITGGEPLIKKNILLEIVDYSSNKNIEISLNSNLSYVDKETANELKKRGIKSILGSLISYDKETHNRISNSNSYDSTINGIKNIIANNISLGINMVVEKENLEHVYKTAELCNRLGVNHFFATKLNPSPYKSEQLDLSLNLEETKKSLDSLIEAKKDFDIRIDILEPLPHCAFTEKKYLDLLDRTCTAGITWIAIGTNGDVRPCTHIFKSYGNILKEDLERIWLKMREWSNEKFVPEKCRIDCLEYAFCGGGCRAGALCKGNIQGDDPLMTQPIKIRLTHEIEKEIKLEDWDLLELNKKAKYRDENFGITVYINPKKVVFLNHDSKKILAKMNHLKRFKLSDIALYTKDNPKEFIHYLSQKGIVKKV